MSNDVLIPLPPNWRYLNQFAPSKWAPAPSNERCGPAATAMAAAFTAPGTYVEAELEDQLYRSWAGPDVVSNRQGSTIEQVIAFLEHDRLPFINLQALVDEAARGNHEPLRLELGHQNEQDVAQIITVQNMGAMHEAVLGSDGTYHQGTTLYPWEGHGEGVSHVIFRVGAAAGIGLYADPAAPSFCVDAKGTFTPARILWTDLVAAGIIHALAIMPHGVPTPPPGFLFQNGTWPEPAKPPIDLTELKQDLLDYKALIDQERTANDATFLKLIAELSA